MEAAAAAKTQKGESDCRKVDKSKCNQNISHTFCNHQHYHSKVWTGSVS